MSVVCGGDRLPLGRARSLSTLAAPQIIHRSRNTTVVGTPPEAWHSRPRRSRKQIGLTTKCVSRCIHKFSERRRSKKGNASQVGCCADAYLAGQAQRRCNFAGHYCRCQPHHSGHEERGGAWHQARPPILQWVQANPIPEEDQRGNREYQAIRDQSEHKVGEAKLNADNTRDESARSLPYLQYHILPDPTRSHQCRVQENLKDADERIYGEQRAYFGRRGPLASKEK